MDTKPETDAEAIAALGAFQPYRTAVWPLASKLDMRRALDAAAAHRRAQPASGLADTARKIAEALRPFSDAADFLDTHNPAASDSARLFMTVGQARSARAALPLAESLPGKIEAVGKLRKALEPFATFGICDDGNDIRDGLMRDRIVDWFGPSDFDAARAALAPIPEKPTPAHDDADLEAAHCIRYQQARELD